MTVVKKKFQTVSDIVNSKQYGMFLAQKNLYQIMVKSYEKNEICARHYHQCSQHMYQHKIRFLSLIVYKCHIKINGSRY